MTNSSMNEVELLVSNFNQSFALFPPFDAILGDLEKLRIKSARAGFKSSMLVFGDTGAGKSALLEHFTKSSQTKTGPKVLRTRVRPSLQETLTWTLHDLNPHRKNDRFIKKASEIGLTDMVIRELKQSNIGMVIIDECQEFVEIRSGDEKKDISNRLKMISEEASVSMVFVGMPWSKEIARDSQWESRIRIVREIPYFKVINDDGSNNKEEMKRFALSLKAISNLMPFSKRPELELPKLSFPLLAYSRGEMRALKDLLADALELALLEGAETLTRNHLKEAAELTTPKNNPFDDKANVIEVQTIQQYTRFELDDRTGRRERFDRAFTALKPIPMRNLLSKR
ncbi:TniB family NTP-binding protein [Enterovibrio paralichthyis]|uniref:TniB family NTP-binding protein n=1 Tax=Enterovibrio paralichthyis TaxID=2853805 RepID=UPI001C445CCB|nr:TniB family NTP-binding protein [Enterovibrio paralichthyis]MBV7297277.1 TniB family NTP-binding protein [Enterovibrio paralichthyis]